LVAIFIDRLIGRLIDRLVGGLIDRLVGGLIDRLMGRLIDRLIGVLIVERYPSIYFLTARSTYPYGFKSTLFVVISSLSAV
jgi:uncharacterized membrane protein required for colicin V production